MSEPLVEKARDSMCPSHIDPAHVTAGKVPAGTGHEWLGGGSGQGIGSGAGGIGSSWQQDQDDIPVFPAQHAPAYLGLMPAK